MLLVTFKYFMTCKMNHIEYTSGTCSMFSGSHGLAVRLENMPFARLISKFRF